MTYISHNYTGILTFCAIFIVSMLLIAPENSALATYVQGSGGGSGGTTLDTTYKSLLSNDAGVASDGVYTGIGLYNNFLGLKAGFSNTTGENNNFFGWEVGVSNTTGTRNNFFGPFAGYANTSGGNNNFFGDLAGVDNTTGYYNNFIGAYAGVGNNTGYQNNFIGPYAGGGNTTGINNSYIGAYSGNQNLIGSSNVALGHAATFGGGSGLSYNNTVAVGYQAGYTIGSLTPGESTGNIFLGYQAGDNITTGSRNVTLGYDIDGVSATGNDQLNIGNMIFGTGINGTGTTISTGNVGIGTNAPTAKLSVNGTANKPGGGSWAVFSDERAKENIETYYGGLEELTALRPIRFNYKQSMGWGTQQHVGLIAQEVEQIMPSMVSDIGEVGGIAGFKQVDPSETTFMLINAAKELKTENDQLRAQISELERRLEALEHNQN